MHGLETQDYPRYRFVFVTDMYYHCYTLSLEDGMTPLRQDRVFLKVGNTHILTNFYLGFVLVFIFVMRFASWAFFYDIITKEIL